MCHEAGIKTLVHILRGPALQKKWEGKKRAKSVRFRTTLDFDFDRKIANISRMDQAIDKRKPALSTTIASTFDENKFDELRSTNKKKFKRLMSTQRVALISDFVFYRITSVTC